MAVGLAAFDFDGTVSRKDTLVPFVARVAGLPRSAVAGSAAMWSAARGHVDWRDRDDVKAHMIERLLTGRSEREMQRLGGEYATRVIDGGLRPEMVDQVRRHAAAGHRTVFVSASLVYYLEPIARYLGVDHVIAVEPEVRDGVLTGAMLHPNVRAQQKALRLREWLGLPAAEQGGGHPDGYEMWAYGNSSGDHALLAMADHAYWLGKPSKCPQRCEQFGPTHAF